MPDATPPYETILQHLPDPVMVVAAGGRVIFANAAARETFRVGDLLATAIRNPPVLEAVDQALAGGEAKALFEGSGGRIWLASARPLEAFALLALSDQTDARAAERMRADFLANASHELRTPLASLLGFIETLRGHAKDDPAARTRFLAVMQRQAERMSRLVDDLMSLSRIELNEHIAPRGRVDLAGAATDVADALVPLLEARKVRLETALPAKAMVEGDRDQIVQVIQNLVDNAVKYAPDGGVVRLEATTGLSLDEAMAARGGDLYRHPLLTPEAGEGRYTALRVTDEGPGMPREHLPRLTERFYRAPGQKSGEHEGTGLGLAIVKHIMNRHRGGMAVESAPGKGAAFTVFFQQA